MPWKIEERDSEFCVIKEADGEVEGCHDSHEKAVAQLGALNASEEKESETKAHVEVYDDGCSPSVVVVNEPPTGPTSFTDLEAKQEAIEAAIEVETLANQFRMMTRNIMSDPSIDDKGAAVQSLAGEFATRVDDAMTQKELEIVEKTILPDEKPGIIERVKSVFKKDEPKPKSHFMVWKEKDDTYRWFAVYSNNYRDDDKPAEIISAKSQRDFVKAVDSGEWPMPELWAWHVKGSRWGVADFVAYDDDTGFAIAAGVVDKGKEHVAEAMAARSDLLVSHGMPRSEIKYADGDPTTLIRHRTKEISPLPASRAANKFTGFMMLEKEEDMNIPKDKKEFLQEIGLDPEVIQTALETQKARLDAAAVESKETKDETEVVEATPELEATVGPVAAPAITAADIGTAIATALTPFMAELGELKKQVDALQSEPPEEKETEPVTPLDAIMLAVRSGVIGHAEARVDGRTKEAKDGPVEKQAGINPRNKLHGFNPVADSVNALFNGELVKGLQGVQ